MVPVFTQRPKNAGTLSSTGVKLKMPILFIYYMKNNGLYHYLMLW